MAPIRAYVDRLAWDGDMASMICESCRFCYTGLEPSAAKERARDHTRRTGHSTLVEHARITEYTKRLDGGES